MSNTAQTIKKLETVALNPLLSYLLESKFKPIHQSDYVIAYAYYYIKFLVKFLKNAKI